MKQSTKLGGCTCPLPALLGLRHRRCGLASRLSPRPSGTHPSLTRKFLDVLSHGVPRYSTGVPLYSILCPAKSLRFLGRVGGYPTRISGETFILYLTMKYILYTHFTCRIFLFQCKIPNKRRVPSLKPYSGLKIPHSRTRTSWNSSCRSPPAPRWGWGVKCEFPQKCNFTKSRAER